MILLAISLQEVFKMSSRYVIQDKHLLDLIGLESASLRFLQVKVLFVLSSTNK